MKPYQNTYNNNVPPAVTREPQAAKDYTNKGHIKPNVDKTKESQPDMKGILNVDGATYWVSAWNTPYDGKIKLAVTKADDRG